MDVSIVIPACNAAPFIADRLKELSTFLETTGLDYEVVVVDDGSKDATATVLRELRIPRLVPILGLAHQGKYGALKSGVAATKGRTILMTDADLPYEFAAIPFFVGIVSRGEGHLAIGDRTLPGSVYAERMGLVRRITNRVFREFIQHVVASGIHDSQCGIKAVRGDIGRILFSLMQEPGFIGDVELLYVSLKYNLHIRRAPVRLRYQGVSTVSALKHGIGMLFRLPGIWFRWRSGKYESSALREIARQDYWTLSAGS